MRDLNSNIYVAGHDGMVGSAITRKLELLGSKGIVTRTRQELDLTRQDAVNSFFQNTRVNQVYIAAAKVGGIHANNTYPAEFIYENLLIETNIINAAFHNGVKKLLFLGSSCIYPKNAAQPMKEEFLLTGELEPTNEPYAIAKIAGIKLCESYNRQYGQSHGIDFRSVMPTNLYGFRDNYHPENSHVIPALIRRFHEAKVSGARNVVVWGSGTPKREFLFVDDMASACVHIMNIDKCIYDASTKPMLSHINVGYGEDIAISDLAGIVAKVTGYDGLIEYDASKPDGTKLKLLDSTKLRNMGWLPSTDIERGLMLTYQDFLRREIK